MALLWADGFDTYTPTGGNSTNADMLASGYSAAWGQGSLVQNAAQARTGIGYYAANSNTQYINRVLDATVSTLIVGVGMYNESVGSTQAVSSNGVHFLANGASVFRVVATSLGSLAVYTGQSAGTKLGESAPNLLNATWLYLEVKAVRDSAAGTIEVRLQGTTVLLITGLNLGTFDWQQVRVGGPVFENPRQTIRYDDLYICDNSGAYNNDFLGDRRCLTLFPNADTASAAWVPSTGTSGFAMIDETPPNDADYIQANATGDISEFQKGSITINTNDIAAVVVFARLQKTDAGTSTARIGVHSNSFVNNSAELAPGTSWGGFRYIVERDPNGGIAWTRANVDAATIRLTREQ